MTYNPNTNFDVVNIGWARVFATDHNYTWSTEEKLRCDYHANDVLQGDEAARDVYTKLTSSNKELHVYTNMQIRRFNEGGVSDKIGAEFDLNAVLDIESPRNPTHKERFLKKRILPNSRSA